MNDISVVHHHTAPRLRRPLRARLLGLPPAEASFSRRGFAPGPARPHLQSIGETFILGYNLALADTSTVHGGISQQPVGMRGFLAEGAAMGGAMRTALLPWRDELKSVLQTLAPDFIYLTHVGVGWAMARLPFARQRLWRRLDPVLAPLALDGWGFHDGYFRPAASLKRRSHFMRGWKSTFHDQGVGRSLWFSCCANADRIAEAIGRCEAARADDLWAGVGLACAYAGGADEATIDRLHNASAGSRTWLAQGAAFAVAAHAQGGGLPIHTSLAARRFCGVEPHALTELVEHAREAAIASQGALPAAYSAWRANVATALAGGAGQ